MNKATLIITAILMVAALNIKAQVAVSTDGSSADPSAMLEVKSTEKGFLLPRVVDTTNVSNPAEGLMIYDLSSDCLRIYNGLFWSDCFGGVKPITACGQPFTDTRNGKSYKTVLIGTQCWMAENLNIGVMLPGTTPMSNNGIIEKYCYNNLPTNCDIYGGLYQWNEMMQYISVAGTKGICPVGWHLPSDAEWCILEQYLDATITCTSSGLRGTDGGGKLKQTGTTYWTNPNTGATNTSGFTALPGGRWTTVYSLIGAYALWWTSSENSSGGPTFARGLSNTSVLVDRNFNDRNFGMSVRCVKDN